MGCGKNIRCDIRGKKDKWFVTEQSTAGLLTKNWQSVPDEEREGL